MAITLVNLVVPRKDRSGRTPFAVFFTSADLSGCEAIKACPTGGRIYLEKLKIWTTEEINWTVGEGETSGAVTAALVGPVTANRQESEVGVVNGVPFDHEFLREIQLTAARDLTIDASGSGTVCGIVEGFTIV